MDKKIYLGIGAIATAGAIMGGIMLAQNKNNPLGIEPGIDESAQNTQKIEELWLEELKNTDKYSFCLGEATIQTSYSDQLLDSSGTLTHKSREILVYSKETQRFSIMSRELEFDYQGYANTKMGEMAVDIPVKEHGSITETYGKNEMPIRVDLSANYIATNPDTKKKDWVYSDMGGEFEMTVPRTGCAGIYQLNNSPGKDLLAGGQTIMVDRECSQTDISGKYDGEFSFNCQAIDYRQALGMLDADRAKEELENTKNMEVFEPADDGTGSDREDGAATGGNQGVETSQPSIPANNTPGAEINSQLEELKREMQNGAAQTDPR
ncbi:MAG: hypothetical protein MUD10_05605 [Candidatus Pacebacteria bacterium]|jgi:hypothetical protein|nr:hypothetical protein [Candidatus Paceibacterota bacterium]